MMNGTNDIRKTFLDYFGDNGHEIVASAPLVPMNDPTLLFTNAGMVPFKNLFTGAETRDYVRATSSQKCVRAGGKHNDLDNVGYTARHHTFFEMLGNFSFGDYFKEEAIYHAWNLITKEYGIDPKRLCVTVYHEDDQAFDLWKKIGGFSDSDIIRIATNDNFWSMGDTGPCGPCSEIFYDHGDHIWGDRPGTPDEDGDRFVEIWNLVFMQFEQMADGTRIDLPKPSIDTGMGLERISALMQGTHNNYETDQFKRLIDSAETAIGKRANEETIASYRVIADHLRSCSFLITDGVLPANEGRGYVLRRIMRRAMRHAHMLGANDLVMHQVVPALVSEMGAAYPDLNRAEALITETLKLEETRFKSMLGKGLKLLDEEMSKISTESALPGDVAFKLYDTYGFPLDLTQDALRSQNRVVDVDGFNKSMDEQRAKARAAWSGSGDAGTDKLWFDLKDELGATEFLGYSATEAEGFVQALVVDGERVQKAAANNEVLVLVNQTPFYAESGGQMGDVGTLIGDGVEITVTDTRKLVGDLHVHVGTVEKGTLCEGTTLELKVNEDRRNKLRANHSATHILHEVLRRHLGDHVTQKGSLVAEDRLRFDIAHPKAIESEELNAVERDVNEIIRGNSPVGTSLMTYDEAVDAGAMALFGEKYGDEVRVVSMGAVELNGQSFSVELCGGTHVKRLGDIGLFVIVSESAVSSGVRRIEALTGEAARQYYDDYLQTVRATSALLKTSPAELKDRVAALQTERKNLERELAEAKKQLALGGGGAKGPDIKEINGTKFLGQILEGVNPKDLRGLVDEAKATVGSGIIAYVATNDGKAALVVGVTEDVVGNFSAVDLIRAAVPAVGGKGGGGRPDMAQAGGPDASGAQAAIEAIETMITKS
ncbi:alanine--tRNA ligase [Temperatibacter marinus]|uniref:Alanine--tRNA ligase n=2 Tax=Temperatibacter marinus TaxID=1456591 RepID=A0AA52H8I0_9PROT|nr:alanine--tRNA ligase [Temperatibacter marinus]WND02151.1 alanine--tRNA ligase [Temperatibacter marinus]